MRLAAALLVLFALPVFADSRQRPNESDTGKLAGTWEGYVVDGRGENPNRGPVHLRLVISGNRMSAYDLSGPDTNKPLGSGIYRVGARSPLPELDATGIVLPGKRERTFIGVYELDGDTLRWCVDNRGKERPSEFRTAAGKYLLVLKRKG
jgi:uncharacterized protein (TIGR03067 family)